MYWRLPHSTKTKGEGSESFPLVNTWGFGESGMLEALCPFPILCSMHFFHLALPELNPFIINQ